MSTALGPDTRSSPDGTARAITARVLIYGLLGAFAVIYLVPLFVMLVTSFKTMPEIQDGNMLALPKAPTFAPWARAWGEACVGLTCAGIKGYFWNSIKMVVPAVLISTMLGALNGYVLTKWRFRGHTLVFGLMLFACFIPFQAVLLPMATVLGNFSRFGAMLEDMTGFGFGVGSPTANLVFVHVVYGLGFTTLFFRNYYEAFPTELVRAAMVDGAGFFQIFRRILLPNSLPIFVVTVIYQFTNIWNDFLFASAYAGSGDTMPMTVALNNVVNTSTGVVEYNVNMAAAMIAALPTLLVYIVAGRYFVRGLMAGAGQGLSEIMPFLEIKGLKKRFGAVEILKGIDIDLDKGGFLVLVGPSGCGKSTLLNTIAGLETISEGEIRLDGQAINTLHPSKRDIAMVFQSYALYPNMTVAGNIAFGMEMRGVPKPEREKAIDSVSKTLQIGHLLDRKPSQLSGGQRQRVAMGRALVRNPRVFLFDEPLSNLDAKLRVDMRTEIKRLHATTGTTVVYVTHDQIGAMTLATKIAVLKDGEVQQVGTPTEIYNKPNNLFVADFMGSPAMNLITTRVVEENGRPVLKLTRGGSADVTLSPPSTITEKPLQAGRELILGIRPEAITDRDGADRNSRAIEFIESFVDVVEPAGSDTFVVTKLGGKTITARMRSDAVIMAGQTVPFAFNLDKAVMFDPETGRRL